jgi:hypothetical protein
VSVKVPVAGLYNSALAKIPLGPTPAAISTMPMFIGVKRVTKSVASAKVTSDKTPRLLGGMGFVGTLIILLMKAGEGLGLWVASDRAELRISQVVVFGMLLLLAEELKTSISDLISYFKNRRFEMTL